MESNIYYIPSKNESIHSVMPSLDYDFAISKYEPGDFRYNFVNVLKKFALEKYQKVIYNCKLQNPGGSLNLVNVYFYMWEEDVDVHYRIEDNNHYLVKLFWKVNEETQLLGWNQAIKWQFFIVNIGKVMRSKTVSAAIKEIEMKIQICKRMSNWDEMIYFFVENNREEIEKIEYKSIREKCYKIVKKYDQDRVWHYDAFHIRVEDYSIYSSIGGYNYFNSDCMFDCKLV